MSRLRHRLPALLLLLTSHALGHDFYPGEAAQIRAVSNRVKAAQKKDSSWIIGLGRSPTPIIADLQNQGVSQIVNLPLSGFRNRPHASPSDRYPPLSESDEKNLFGHFDRMPGANPERRSSSRRVDRNRRFD